jgi:hypothetical protein
MTQLVAALGFAVAGIVLSTGSGAARQLADTTPPTIQQPANVTVASDGSMSADVTFTVNATDPDNNPSDLKINCSWGSAGQTFTSGTTTQRLSVGTWPVQCYAFDPAGNTSSTVSFTITITPFVDTTPPVIAVANQTVPAASAAGTTLFYNVSASDPDDSPSSVTVNCDHNLAGGLFPIGTTTVTCTAHDPAGNQATPATFTVTVTPVTTTTTTTTTTTVTTTTSAPPPDVTGCSNSTCMANSIDFFQVDGLSCDFGSFNWSKTDYQCAAGNSSITPPLTIHTGNQTGDVSITFANNGRAIGVASTKASGQQSGIYYTSAPFDVAPGPNVITISVIDPLHRLAKRVYTFSFSYAGAPTTTTTATTTPAPPSPPASGSSHSAGAGSTSSQLPTATVTKPAVTTTTGGRQKMSFSIRLSSAATLEVALIGPSRKTVLRFQTHAKQGQALVSRPISGQRLRQGSRLVLEVTVARHGKHRTLTKSFTV